MSDPAFTKRVIEAHTIYSVHLNEERTVKVYLPPGFHADRRYPVLYCHDGLEFFTHGRIATIANQRIAEGSLHPLLIVGIAVNRAHRADDYSPDGARAMAYQRFVTDEVVRLVESKYPAHGRFMAGISLGAACSLALHLAQPQLFPRLLLFSGAFYEGLQTTVRSFGDLSGLAAYMVVGRQETEVDISSGVYDFYRANHAMRDLLTRRGADLSYREEDGTHIWGFWQRLMPQALQWLDQQVSTGYSSAP